MAEDHLKWIINQQKQKRKQKNFEGALPTTIYQAGYSEIYGLNPDIDSTALIISTTSWILTKILKEKQTINEDTNINDQSKTSHNPSLHLSKYSKSLSQNSIRL